LYQESRFATSQLRVVMGPEAFFPRRLAGSNMLKPERVRVDAE